MKIHDMPQYSDLWWEARKGKVTASNAASIITPAGKKMPASAQNYINQLLADHHCQTPNFFTDQPRNRDMEHGTNCEPEARRWLAMDRLLEITEVGGCESDCGRYWCSPDGLVYADQTLIEIKCPNLKTHMGYLRDPDKLANQYRCQCHFQLMVTGWPRVLLLSYVVGASPLALFVEPDGFTTELRVAAELFWAEYLAAMKKVKGGA